MKRREADFGLTIGVNGLFLGALAADVILAVIILIIQRRSRGAALSELKEEIQ